jgi:hypothetical protein
VDFLTPLAFYSLHRFGTLQTLTAPVHLRIYVSDSVFELLHLFQLAVQFFLQLAVPMHFGAEAVVSEASQCVVDPIFAPIVVVENAHALRRRRRRLFRRKSGCRVGWSSIYWGSRSGHAQGVGVISHVDGDVSGLNFAAIVHDFEGDVARGYVEPELLWYARSWLRVRGASCSRRARSSSSARRLSSPGTSSYGTYLHRRLFGCGIVCSPFILNRNGFFVTRAALERGLASTTYSVNSFHVMVVAEEDGEGVALTGAHGVSASQTDDFVSKTGAECPDELTRLSGPSSTSLCAVTILSSFCATGAVRKDRRRLSIRRRTISTWSLLHSFASFVHADLSDFCCVAQLDSSSMGTVGRDATGFGRREHGSGFFDGIAESGDKDGVVREGTLVVVGSQRCHWHSNNSRW